MEFTGVHCKDAVIERVGNSYFDILSMSLIYQDVSSSCDSIATQSADFIYVSNNSNTAVKTKLTLTKPHTRKESKIRREY